MSPLEDSAPQVDTASALNMVVFETIKLPIPPDVLKETGSNLAKYALEIQKLVIVRNPLIVNVNRIWFEGREARELSELTGASLGETSSPESDTFLCIDQESHQYVTLSEWLRTRHFGNLLESQIVHMTSQIAGAVTFLEELGVSLESILGLENVHVLQEPPTSPQLSTNAFPTVKLSLTGVKNLSAPPEKLQTPFQFLKELWNSLITHNHQSIPKNPQLSEIFEDIESQNEAIQTCKNVQTKLGQKLASYQIGLTYGLHQPSKHFIGRSSLETSLLEILTDARNKLIVIHGPPGIGKTELVLQLSHKLLDKTNSKTNILRLDASSSDNLTACLYNCIGHPQLSSSPLDYIRNPRLLKDIFSEILVALSESDLLLIFDNAEILSAQVLDLLQAFKDNAQNISSSAHHHLILITRELWTSCPFLKESDCTTLDLSGICKSDSLSFLTEFERPGNENSAECTAALADILEGHPAALQIIAQCIPENGLSAVLESLENFQVKYAQTQTASGTMRPVCLAYTFSLTRFYEKLATNEERICCENVLKVLHGMNGEAGVDSATLQEVLKHLNTPCQQIVLSVVTSFSEMRLLSLTDRIIRVSTWAQTCIQVFLQMVLSKDDIVPLLSSCYIVLSSKSLETEVWRLISHAQKIWLTAALQNLEFPKRFDTLPELVAKLAKSFDKLELVTGFLKESLDIFSRAYANPHDIHVLKLKYSLAADSLLPRGCSAEAFLIFKSIQENCRTEPREYLMIKLKSLIELGKIHTNRQEFEKAISCYQHVQVFAVQKIGVLQLDSEPTVLNARLLHGQAFLEQGNLEESKKIILQVIPLLERYTGHEIEFVGGLVLLSKYCLAVLLRQMGDLVNALMLQTKVTEERERIYGNKHPDTWASKREMCLLFSAYDNHEKALALLRNLLEIQEQVLGAPSNRHSLATMNSIAEIEAKLGNFDDALELYEAIDLIEQQVLGESDPMRISSQLSQAEVLVSLGQYKEACDIYDLVYTLRSTSEEKSSQTEQLLESIQRKKEAAERSMEVLGNYWLSLTPENVDDPSELAALAKKHEVALQLAENQDNQGALRFLREVLEDCTQLDETNRFHLNVKADLARVLGLVGRFNESFSVYKEIIPLLDATFGETDELTMLCKDTMGQVFLFSGNQFLKRQMSNLKWFLL